MRRRILMALLAGPLALAAAFPATFLTASAAPGADGQTNWPQFRFNQARTGVQPFETILNANNVPRLQVSFADQLGQLVQGSSPAVVDGVAYIGSFDGTLWAYPADGCGQTLCTTPLWKSTNLGEMISSPTVVNGIVYVGSQTSFSSNDGKLNAFAAAGCGQAVCAPMWQGRAGIQSILDSSPAVAGDTVFVGAFDGKLYAFDANGCGSSLCNPVWTGTTGASIESSPTVANGVVYIGSDDGNLYAFPAAGCGGSSCQPLWKGPIGGPAFSSSPAVANGAVYIGSDHFISAFKAAGCGAPTCQPAWQGTNGVDFFAGSPAVGGGRVYIGDESMLAVFNAKGCGQPMCSPLWFDFGSGFQASILSSPTLANGVVYAGRNTGEVLAWRAGPCGQLVCNQIWSGAVGDQIVSSSPTVVNGKLYIGSADNLFPEDIQGRLYVFGLP